MDKVKRKILIINGRYLPGYKDGGPVRTIKNITDYMGEEYDFRILTIDRDHGDNKPYSDIKYGEWNEIGNAKVYYVKPNKLNFSIIRKMCNSVDLVYICGCFSSYSIKAILLNKIHLINKPIFIASMGLFSPLALKIKNIKKKYFITLCNALNLFNNIYWSATSEIEANDILNNIKTKREQIYIAQDLPRKIKEKNIIKDKKKNELKIVWISRISPKKNLLKVIKILEKMDLNITLSIYGSIHDNQYWEQCENELKKLPNNIKYYYYGEVDSEKVIETLSKYHLFLFLTLGENYGHVIYEALASGCPCIISDQTPWKDLEKNKVGFVCNINSDNEIIEKIKYYTEMDNTQFQEISNKTLEYIVKKSNITKNMEQYRKIFNKN